MSAQASGFTTNYTDPNSGINLPEAWVQITNILYIPYSYSLIVFDVFNDYAAFENQMAPIFTNLRGQINFLTLDWKNYFDPEIMDLPGHNIQKQAISWLEANITTIKR
jgi:hypothetical protein